MITCRTSPLRPKNERSRSVSNNLKAEQLPSREGRDGFIVLGWVENGRCAIEWSN